MLNLEELKQTIQQQMQTAQVPGLSLAVTQGHQIIYADGFGVTSIEPRMPAVTPHTRFRIGMLTIPLTCIAILRLVEENVLDFDQPVNAYLPDLVLSTPGATEQITLRILLNCTAGLPSANEPFGRRDPAGLRDSIYNEIAHFPLATPPGTIFRYSTPSIDMAGYVAEHVSGIPFARLMQELVFTPLQMTSTTFDPLVAMTYPLTQSHYVDETGTLQVNHCFAENTACYPSTMVISTVMDLTNVAAMLIQNGHFRGQQVLSAESVAALISRQARLYNADDDGWGYGFFHRQYKGTKLLVANGAVQTVGSVWMLAPEDEFSVTLCFNRDVDFWSATTPLLYTIVDQLLGLPPDNPPRVTVPPDKTKWSDYVGTYLGEGGLVTVQIEAGELAVDWNGDYHVLRALASDCYLSEKATDTMSHWEQVWANLTVGFVPETKGPTQFIVINGEWSCRRVDNLDLPAPDPAAWSNLLGRYSNEAGDITITISAADDMLFVQFSFFDVTFSCRQLGKHQIVSKLGVMTFTEERDGQMQLLESSISLYRRSDDGTTTPNRPPIPT